MNAPTRLLLALLLGTVLARAAGRPNVLFIMADDLRAELATYGSPAHTPNLDRLAKRALQFDRAYCQQAVCNPSRSSMLTGRRPDTLGLWNNGTHFREALTKLGFDLVPGHHPIIPVMLGDAELATRAADALLKEGVYVIGFSYPVVPKGKARLRTQMSAAHTPAQIDRAIAAFARVGKALGAIR